MPEVQKRKRPSGHLNPTLITPAAGIPLFPLGIKLVLKLWQLLGTASVILLGLGELSRGYLGVISLALFPHFRVSRWRDQEVLCPLSWPLVSTWAGVRPHSSFHSPLRHPAPGFCVGNCPCRRNRACRVLENPVHTTSWWPSGLDIASARVLCPWAENFLLGLAGKAVRCIQARALEGLNPKAMVAYTSGHRELRGLEERISLKAGGGAVHGQLAGCLHPFLCRPLCQAAGMCAAWGARGEAVVSLSPTLPVCPSRLGWCLQALPTLVYSHGLEEEQRGQAAVVLAPTILC